VKNNLVSLIHQTKQTMKNEIKTTIETKLNKSVNFVKATDGANLLYTATINELTVANVYKSYDENFNLITVIRYNNEAF
jgi:hypothetical protein